VLALLILLHLSGSVFSTKLVHTVVGIF